jgi:hypothetical protein
MSGHCFSGVSAIQARRVRRSWAFVFSALLLSPVVAPVPNSVGAMQRVNAIRIPFVENQGQIPDKSVAFYAQTFGGAVYATRDGEMLYSLPKADGTNILGGAVLRERLLGARRTAPEAAMWATAKVSYFVGNDPGQWKAGLSTWDAVSLGEPYAGIRMDLRAHGSSVEKIFTVAPGADPARIRLAVDGADSLGVADDGTLTVRTSMGDVCFSAPVAYQEFAGTRRDVAVAYRVEGHCYSFEVGDYDRARSLVIDPLLASTFLGGTTSELANDVRVDPSGHVFVVGWTHSSNFPIKPGAFDAAYNGDYDAFVSKLDSGLSNLLASTFLGGSGEDNAQISALDADGNIYVAGYTRSVNFPTTPGAYDNSYSAGPDFFISKLDGNLTNLLASTYLGGSGDDTPRGIALDRVSNVVVAGWSASANYPTTPGAYDPSHNGDQDAVISKLNNSLTNLLASTFLGGSGRDSALALVLDGSGRVYVSGDSYSTNYPTTPNAYATRSPGWGDMVISKLDAGLSNLLASTYVGGRGDTDQALAIALDSGGHVLVAGWSQSADFPTTPGAYDPFYSGSRDAVISKLDGDLTNLLASTYVGGSGADWFAHGLELDAAGRIHVAGYSDSIDYPVTLQAYSPTNNGGVDVIISTLDPNLTNLVASTYLGGAAGEYATSLALDATGNVYIAGSTSSGNYPTTPGAYDTNLNAVNSVNLSKLDPGLSRPAAKLAADFYGNPRLGPAPLSVCFNGLVAGTNTTISWYGWDFDDDGSWDLQGAGLSVVTKVYAAPGFYSIRMGVSNTVGESAFRTRRYYVRVPPLTYHVSPSGSNALPYADWTAAATDIGWALRLANDGDTVLVTDAVYRVSPIGLVEAVRVQSVNGPGATILDAGGSIRCLFLANTGAVVNGFTITGGNAAADDGGGVYIAGGGVLENCIVVSNRAQWGGGVYCAGGGIVEHCAIRANSVTGIESAGGGGALDGGGTVRNCLITGNSAEYGAGGVICWDPGPLVQNCTVVSNSATSAGGLVLYGGGTVEDCIVYFNLSLDGTSNYWVNVANFSHTCTAPPVSGPGNNSGNPLFMNAALGDFHLAAGSPCIDQGSNLASIRDDLDRIPRPLDGNNDGTNVADMGCYEFVHPSADSDGDWLNDTNELAQGTDPVDPDSDHDGMGDGAEVLAGCDPLNDASYLGIEWMSRSGTGLVVRWQSVNGRRYRLDRSTNLVSGPWSLITSNILGVAPLNTETDATASGMGPWMYRIGLEQP